jgi:transketolase
MTFADIPTLFARLAGDEKHSASAESTLDVLWVLYDTVMRVDPQNPAWSERDRFLLSKGHGPMAYYAVLAAKGFIPPETLDTFGAYDSPLGQHPDGTLIPGVEIGSGSLGHGLPIAVGVALALRAKAVVSHESSLSNGETTSLAGGARPPHVFCLLGDAELEEGSNHEAIAFAGRAGLKSLTAIVVDNRSSSLGWPGGIESRFEQEGWTAAVVDGRDHETLRSALAVDVTAAAPHLVVAQVERKE